MGSALGPDCCMCCGTVGKGLLESFLDLLMLSATITTQSSSLLPGRERCVHCCHAQAWTRALVVPGACRKLPKCVLMGRNQHSFLFSLSSRSSFLQLFSAQLSTSVYLICHGQVYCSWAPQASQQDPSRTLPGHPQKNARRPKNPTKTPLGPLQDPSRTPKDAHREPQIPPQDFSRTLPKHPQGHLQDPPKTLSGTPPVPLQDPRRTPPESPQDTPRGSSGPHQDPSRPPPEAPKDPLKELTRDTPTTPQRLLHGHPRIPPGLPKDTSKIPPGPHVGPPQDPFRLPQEQPHDIPGLPHDPPKTNLTPLQNPQDPRRTPKDPSKTRS